MNGLEFLERMRKAVMVFRDLEKMDPEVERAHRSVAMAEKAGHVERGTLEAIKRDAFRDKLVPSMGNVGAYNEFLKSPKAHKGVHIRIDINDFKLGFNTPFGWEQGTEAIKAFGEAVRHAADKHVGRKVSKVWHIGGDEFHVFVPEIQHAARFARGLRMHLESLPPFHGQSQLSACMGFGETPAKADMAIDNFAKMHKRQEGRPPGQARTHAHSLVAGHEGPIPLDDDYSSLMSSLYSTAQPTTQPYPPSEYPTTKPAL
jgi:GGDEF domain-containing protein